MKTPPKEIYLPHINYTVRVRQFKKAPQQLPNARAYVESLDDHSCTLYIENKPHPCDLAHEVVHVLQFIALSRNMDFKLEQEHFGYMMQYIMGQVLGEKWQ